MLKLLTKCRYDFIIIIFTFCFLNLFSFLGSNYWSRIQGGNSLDERFAKTLPGFIIQIINENGYALSFIQIKNAVEPVFSTLRKSNGGIYRGSLERSIINALNME